MLSENFSYHTCILSTHITKHYYCKETTNYNTKVQLQSANLNYAGDIMGNKAPMLIKYADYLVSGNPFIS